MLHDYQLYWSIVIASTYSYVVKHLMSALKHRTIQLNSLKGDHRRKDLYYKLLGYLKDPRWNVSFLSNSGSCLGRKLDVGGHRPLLSLDLRCWYCGSLFRSDGGETEWSVSQALIHWNIGKTDHNPTSVVLAPASFLEYYSQICLMTRALCPWRSGTPSSMLLIRRIGCKGCESQTQQQPASSLRCQKYQMTLLRFVTWQTTFEPPPCFRKIPVENDLRVVDDG